MSEVSAADYGLDTVKTHADLAAKVRDLGRHVGLSLRQIERRTKSDQSVEPLTRSTLSKLLAGNQPFKPLQLGAYLHAVRVPDAQREAWMAAWRRADDDRVGKASDGGSPSRQPPVAEPAAAETSPVERYRSDAPAGDDHHEDIEPLLGIIGGIPQSIRERVRESQTTVDTSGILTIVDAVCAEAMAELVNARTRLSGPDDVALALDTPGDIDVIEWADGLLELPLRQPIVVALLRFHYGAAEHSVFALARPAIMAAMLATLQSAESADWLVTWELDASVAVLNELDAVASGTILAACPPAAAAGLVKELPEPVAARALNEMRRGQAAAILLQLPPIAGARVFAEMKRDLPALLFRMANLDPEAAAELMRRLDTETRLLCRRGMDDALHMLDEARRTLALRDRWSSPAETS